MSIVLTNFEKFKEDLINATNCENILIQNYLALIANEVAEEWGDNADFNESTQSPLINKENTVCEYTKTIHSQHTNPSITFELFVIAESGAIYKAKTKTSKTGNTTWNGDDEYFDTFSTEYVDVEKVGQLENKIFYKNSEVIKELTPEVLEQTGSELVCTVREL